MVYACVLNDGPISFSSARLLFCCEMLHVLAGYSVWVSVLTGRMGSWVPGRRHVESGLEKGLVQTCPPPTEDS